MTIDILERLQSADNKIEREWLVLQFSLDSLDSDLRDAVWAAAIPHWFDLSYLSCILLKPIPDTEVIYKRLINLSFVEPFPDRGYSIHEHSRMLLLNKLWQNNYAIFLKSSKLAFDFCRKQDQENTDWCIETIYHLLISEPEKGANELRDTASKWCNHPYFAFDKVELLIRGAKEHGDAGRLSARSLNWTLFWDASLDYNYMRYEASKNKLLQIRSTLDIDLSARSADLLGKIYLQLDDYAEAQKQFESALSLYKSIGDKTGESNCIQTLAHLTSIFEKTNFNLSSISTQDLGLRCGASKPDNSHERFCLELFRRAIVDNNQESWSIIYERYSRLVRQWIANVPTDSLSDISVDELVVETFTRFWRAFTPKKFSQFTSLASILSYLKSCTLSTVVDARRSQARQIDYVDQSYPQSGVLEDEVVAKLNREHLWSLIEDKCVDDRERTVAMLSFATESRPTEIYNLHKDLFRGTDEVYQIVQSLRRRLVRDPKLRELFEIWSKTV